MSKEKVEAILKKSGNQFSSIAVEIYRGHDKALTLYLIQVGLETCASKIRATARREIRHTVLKRDFVPKPGGVKYSVQLSQTSKRKLAAATINLFRSWKIGNIDLGDATRDKLFAEAKAERASGKGHVRNAVFYEALAIPMRAHETVSDHWQSSKAVALIRDEIWKDTEKKEIAFVEKAA